MRVNPRLANLQYMYANGDTASALPEGTYSNLAAAKYVKDNDKDHDKCLTSDEVTLSQEAFDLLDQDKNGKIDLKEMKEGLKGQDAAIEAYYKNRKSTSGSPDLASTLLESDADTTASTAAATYSAKAAASYIDSKDKDSDDSLSREEAALSKASFDKLDTDKNGKLSASEVQAALKAKEEAFAIYYKNNVPSRSIIGLTSSLLKTI